jgi:hypothetical protein
MRRRATSAFIAAFLALQLGVPAAWYVGENRDDERFRWRMFSSQAMESRTQRCELDLAEWDAAGSPGSLSLASTLPELWITALQRRAPRVDAAILRWRCRQPGILGARLERRCTLPDGEVRVERVEVRCAEALSDRGGESR